MTDEQKKDIDEVIAEKNAEEKKAEAKRGGADHRTQPTEEKKDKSIKSITSDVPPNKEKVNLLNKLKDKVKRKPTATTTDKGADSERVPEKENTESEVVKQSKVRNKSGISREHAFNDDGVCVRCGVGKETATTHCFGRPLPRVTAEKVKNGFVDFHNGAWKKRKPLDEEAKVDEDEDDDTGSDDGIDEDEKEEK